jgi:cathepsin F
MLSRLSLLPLLAFASAENVPLPDISSADALRTAYATWAPQYGKAFEEQRMQYFAASVKEVARLRKADPGVFYNLNQWSDLADDERRSALGLNPVQDMAPLARSCLSNGVSEEEVSRMLSKYNASALPQEFSWTDKQGVVPPVVNQGQCGSCWAFSTAGTIQMHWAIKTQKQIDLSVQEIVDCSHACAEEPPYGQVCNQGCGGGWPWSAMTDIINWKGLVTTAQYPYTGMTGQCKQNLPSPNAPVTNYTCLSHTAATNGGPASETHMQQFLMNNGPLSIAMDATPLMSYSGGILGQNGLQCSQDRLDHAIIIVGWGQAQGTDYWLVRNSWGAQWGEQGYFRVVRNQDACGLAAAVTFPLFAK